MAKRSMASFLALVVLSACSSTPPAFTPTSPIQAVATHARPTPIPSPTIGDPEQAAIATHTALMHVPDDLPLPSDVPPAALWRADENSVGFYTQGITATLAQFYREALPPKGWVFAEQFTDSYQNTYGTFDRTTLAFTRGTKRRSVTFTQQRDQPARNDIVLVIIHDASDQV